MKRKIIQKPGVIGWSFLVGILLFLLDPIPSNADDHGNDCGSATPVEIC